MWADLLLKRGRVERYEGRAGGMWCDLCADRAERCEGRVKGLWGDLWADLLLKRGRVGRYVKVEWGGCGAMCGPICC